MPRIEFAVPWPPHARAAPRAMAFPPGVMCFQVAAISSVVPRSMIIFCNVSVWYEFPRGVGCRGVLWGWPLWGAVQGIVSAVVLSAGGLLLGISFVCGARFMFRILCSMYRVMQYSMGVPFHRVLASTLLSSNLSRAVWGRRSSL
jgi:hypothetical protein